MSKSMINIRESDAFDSHARYRMPDLELRTKHNLTYVTNLSEICKALKIETGALSKFLGNALNCMSKFKNKELQLNGLHGKDAIMKQIRAFINEYVICPGCDLPELDYYAKKKGLRRICRSCGLNQKCDVNEKVYKIIHLAELSNPSKKIMKATPKVGEEKVKKVKSEFELPDDDDIEWGTDTSPEAAEARKKEIFESSSVLKDLIQ